MISIALLTNPRWIEKLGVMGRTIGSVVGAYSLLTKETAVLSLAALAEPKRIKSVAYWLQPICMVAVIVLPTFLWSLYVRSSFGSEGAIAGNIEVPFTGFIAKCSSAFRETIEQFPKVPVLELLAPWSIFFQAIYLLRYPNIHNVWWRFGIGFALLACVLVLPSGRLNQPILEFSCLWQRALISVCFNRRTPEQAIESGGG